MRRFAVNLSTVEDSLLFLQSFQLIVLTAPPSELQSTQSEYNVAFGCIGSA